MLTEGPCRTCGKPTITVDSPTGKLTVDREHAEDGNIVIKGTDAEAKAVELATPEKAMKLLKLAGVEVADRHRRHRCRKQDVNRMRQEKARRGKKERRERAREREQQAEHAG